MARQNQRVTEAIMERITNESQIYDTKVVKSKEFVSITKLVYNIFTAGAIHRYYESRRRIVIEDLPERQDKSNYQKKKRKYRARQQRVCQNNLVLEKFKHFFQMFDRRSKVVMDDEQKHWEHINPSCMTEESDDDGGEKIVTHKLQWRSPGMYMYIYGVCDLWLLHIL